VGNLKKTNIYIKAILIPVIVGGIVGFLISRFMDYNSLQKAILAPPSIVFPIVWTILYILMGVSYGILKNNNLTNKEINLIYYLQLGFNAMWSIFFFILKWRLFSFIWIIILAILIIFMIIKFYNKNKISGLLQIPYLLWVIFASYLNIAFYILNR
jgi:tryptophan-rich sensory protein